jgi:hypothetical protein
MVTPTCRSALRAAVAVLAAAAQVGCIYDGAYLVRGAVSAARNGPSEPLTGARVVVLAQNRTEGSRSAAATGADGSYQVRYLFGGMGFLFITPSDGDPVLEVSASGYRTCTVRLRDGEQRGVTRRPCPAVAGRCYGVDVVLAPAGPAATASGCGS